MPELSEQQKKAVERRHRNTLVSAAAGSGKTFVLANRAVSMLLDPERPVPADRLLISTFTKAAAAQMKNKIRAELLKNAHRAPKLAARQMLLLEIAQIGTIDSFCLSLVREHGAAAGFPPTVSVAAEDRLAALSREVLDDILTKRYKRGDPAFLRLASLYFTRPDDDRLEQDILALCRCCESLVSPSEWLEDCARAFEPENSHKWQDLAAGAALGEIRRVCEQFRGLSSQAREEGNGRWTDYLCACAEACETLAASAQNGFSPLSDALAAFNLKNAPPASKNNPDTPFTLFLKKAKTECSQALQEIKRTFFSLSPGEIETQAIQLRSLGGELYGIAADYLSELEKRKREEELFGFSDICRMAFGLLVRRDPNGSLSRTPLAAALSADYDEIMIDEFQDVNDLQYEIFRAVSDGHNLFMVGDAKQSIYRFRNSRPEIFNSLAGQYGKGGDGLLLPLNNNYRSHPAVLDAANFIFGLLMHEKTAELEYGEEERLHCGLPGSHGGEGGFDFQLLQKGELSDAETEADYIAGEIHSLMSKGIWDKGERRNAVWSDFCVLTRGNAYGRALNEALAQRGIPCAFHKKGNLFEEPAVAELLALLRAVNNPLDGVAVLAAAMSPVWDFTVDDLALISEARSHTSVYARIAAARDDADHPRTAEKCGHFLSCLTLLQDYSALMPLPELISAAAALTDMESAAPVSGMADCRESLAAFVRYAALAEEGGGGLHGFIQTVDSAIAREKCPETGLSGGGDAVSLMTVHGSKGLEFPVCFLAGCHKKLFRPERNILVADTSASFALKLPTKDGKGLYSPWHRDLISGLRRQKERAEEMRLLYVALTRARCHMIVSAVCDDCVQYVGNVAARIGGQVCAYSAAAGLSYADWITAAALHHPGGGELRALTGTRTAVLKAGFDWRVGINLSHEQKPPKIRETEIDQTDTAFSEILKERLSFSYRWEELCDKPGKFTVTSLAKSGTELARPAFASPNRGARYGTLLHEFLELCPFSEAPSGARVLAKRLHAEGKLSGEALRSLNFDAVDTFFSSDLFSEICRAREIYKEYFFISNIPIGEVLKDVSPLNAGVPVLLQGCADCVAVFPDHILLADYKTDRVDHLSELAGRYALQLNLYAKSLSAQFGLPVRKKVIYSFSLGAAVEIP